jgi:hypothetical protein
MFIGTCSVTTAPVSAFTKKSDSMLIFHSCSRLLGIRLTVGDLHDGLHSHLRPADIDYWYLAFVDWACRFEDNVSGKRDTKTSQWHAGASGSQNRRVNAQIVRLVVSY